MLTSIIGTAVYVNFIKRTNSTVSLSMKARQRKTSIVKVCFARRSTLKHVTVKNADPKNGMVVRVFIGMNEYTGRSVTWYRACFGSKRLAGSNPVAPTMATIESYGDDQGGGASFCSNCNYNLTTYLVRIESESKMLCPNCKSELSYGGIYPYSFGGTDY